MGKPHPLELRRRVVDFVDEGHSHRAAARHFRVSPRFVNDLIVLRRETGSLEAKRQGNRGHNGKYQGVEAWLRSRVSECGELTLDELRVELERECRITVHRATVCDWLHRFGLSHKKTLLAAEQRRVDVARDRHIWIARRQPFMRDALERMAFVDETSLNTKLVKTSGWAPVGERLIDYAVDSTDRRNTVRQLVGTTRGKRTFDFNRRGAIFGPELPFANYRSVALRLPRSRR